MELLPIVAIVASLGSMSLCVTVWAWLRGRADILDRWDYDDRNDP